MKHIKHIKVTVISGGRKRKQPDLVHEYNDEQDKIHERLRLERRVKDKNYDRAVARAFQKAFSRSRHR